MHRNPAFRPLVLAALLVTAGCARRSAATHADAQRERFAAMFARGYVPGRSGQLFVVPDSGYFLVSGDTLHRYMHGTPWPCDTRIPLLFVGSPFVHAGTYPAAASLQNVAPTLLAMAKATIPGSMTGTPLTDAIASTARKPAAVVVIVLDGMGRETWDHWEASLPTLARLHREGAWFENMALDFLPTVTAVGHATVSTGTDPRFHGIQGNSNLDGDMYHGKKMLPGALSESTLTLADAWEREFPEIAHIVVHGTSARATVGLAGHGKCIAGGRAITVAMLGETEQERWFSNDSCYGKVPDYLLTGNPWALYRAHQVLPDTGWVLFLRTPWLVDLEADALLKLIANEQIGRDTIPDLLLVNLKTPDYVSHRYGPFSDSVGTALHHLDRALARIVAKLDAATGERGYVLAITADHGMPTQLAPGEGSFTLKSLSDALRAHLGADSTAVLHYGDASSHQVYVDRGKLEASHHTLAELGRYLETLPHVKYAYPEDEIRKVKL
jgi:hypothetical protein